MSESIPEAMIDERRRVSTVWLIPLVAVIAAIWLGYRAYVQQGPLVTISFKTAEGLEAGKTRVRFKDVDVGVVETIELSSDLSGVRVRARLSANVGAFLNAKTQFWVVRPRLSRGQISGLGTLLGGTYIAVDFSHSSDEDTRDFVGLETPPLVTATEAGSMFLLTTPTLGSLSEGSPVLYRGVEVGRVVSYQLRGDGGVTVQVFVQSPHDRVIGANTRFWNVSGIDVSVDANGVKLDLESLASLLLGGIAFGNPAQGDQGDAVHPEHEFALHDNMDTAFAPIAHAQQRWELRFDGSVRGLMPGAPVEFRGIRIGEVELVDLKLGGEPRDTYVQVVVSLDPARLGIEDQAGATTPSEAARKHWDQLVAGGLAAQLSPGSVLTGSLYVEFGFFTRSDRPNAIDWNATTPQLPTVPSMFDNLRDLVQKLADLPIDRVTGEISQTMDELHGTLLGTKNLLGEIQGGTMVALNDTLKQTSKTLQGIDNTLLKPTSPLQSEAYRVLRELSEAARSLRLMADYLERHPEALLRGKGTSQ